jgi:hypothetical protein
MDALQVVLGGLGAAHGGAGMVGGWHAAVLAADRTPAKCCLIKYVLWQKHYV